MPLEIGLWRVTDNAVQLTPAKMPLESRLKKMILDDPAILETKLLVLGSEVATQYGKFIDILGIDVDGKVHIIELKRDRTPREIVAQALDYASWVQGQSNDDIREIFAKYNPGQSFDVAFAECFEGTSTPDDLNEEHSITVVASDLDDSTGRIVEYLNATYSVPINVMLFRYFSDAGNDYLARTWLIPESQTAATSITKKASPKAAWNGTDWYVAFGTENKTRSWNDAVKYGFVSAGGGDWYSRSLRKLPLGARIFVYMPGSGYVGVGLVTGPAVSTEEAVLQVDGVERAFSQLQLEGRYEHDGRPDSADDSDVREYIVPVHWETTVAVDKAFWMKGLFANQNSACKLRHELTITEVSKAFGLNI